MIEVRFVWFSSDGADTEYTHDAFLHQLPREGDRVDIMTALTDADLPEEERCVTNVTVTRVQLISFAGEDHAHGLLPKVYVERDPEVQHQREMDAVRRQLSMVRGSVARLLSMLNLAAHPAGIFNCEASEDDSVPFDLVCFRTRGVVPQWVLEAADVVYEEGTGKLLKHRYKPMP